MSKQKVAVLIDGDPYAFAAAELSEEVNDFDGIYVNTANIEKAFAIAKSNIDAVCKQLRADTVIFTLSCATRSYWRHDINPAYKGGRKEYRGPICMPDLKEMLAEHYTTERWDNMEADDVLGILATDENYLPDHKKIVVSIDKDMLTLPDTWIYNPDKDYQPWFNKAKDAEFFFLQQAIGGDTTDGYTGCRGTSTDGAATFLTDPWLWETYEHVLKSGKRKGETDIKWRKVPGGADLWSCIVSLYVKAGQTEEDALLNARMARICRSEDFDGQVILWTPEKLNAHT